ncbi:hypothetical protein LX32DRAFT_246961 [Colletotrichum zoysiae]|uniref:Uncharacterized protein n=1 Tax=Colletotrichum zoysiae TaxID=1216348 RepID=A0AAD9HPN4_9PEZI|nr:hypothetical protein LX32DRAFT_246961 [Colletotrichum zoysiae]
MPRIACHVSPVTSTPENSEWCPSMLKIALPIGMSCHPTRGRNRLPGPPSMPAPRACGGFRPPIRSDGGPREHRTRRRGCLRTVKGVACFLSEPAFSPRTTPRSCLSNPFRTACHVTSSRWFLSHEYTIRHAVISGPPYRVVHLPSEPDVPKPRYANLASGVPFPPFILQPVLMPGMNSQCLKKVLLRADKGQGWYLAVSRALIYASFAC